MLWNIVDSWKYLETIHLNIDDCVLEVVGMVDTVHFVEMPHVILEKIVHLVQAIAVPASQYPHIIVEI